MNARRVIIGAGLVLGAALLLRSRGVGAAMFSGESFGVQDDPFFFGDFTALLEGSEGYMSVETAVNHPNVQAFLRMIRYAEGTADGDGYRRHFGGDLFESFADHPRVVKEYALQGGDLIRSSAAGAYQFLKKTWDDVAPKIGAADFSPYWQDRAAVYLIKRRGALDDVLAGNFYEAVDKVRGEWASMPGAGYGQPEKDRLELAQVYADNGGAFA